MSLFLIVLLVIFFAYSIALVLANNTEIAVNLLFSQVPVTNLGLVLILTITLGIFIGILLALLLFKVLQNKFEIRKLRKDIKSLEGKLQEANIVIEHSRQSHLLVDEVEKDTLAKQSSDINSNKPPY